MIVSATALDDTHVGPSGRIVERTAQVVNPALRRSPRGVTTRSAIRVPVAADAMIEAERP